MAEHDRDKMSGGGAAKESGLPSEVERGLRDMTAWKGPGVGETRLWVAALESRETRSPVIRIMSGRRILGGLAAAAAVLLVVAFVLPEIGSARHVGPGTTEMLAKRSADPSPVAPRMPAPSHALQEFLKHSAVPPSTSGGKVEFAVPPAAAKPTAVASSAPLEDRQLTTAATRDAAPQAGERQEMAGLPVAAAASARSVVHKANIELAVRDVRGAFAKVQQMLRPELGEFAEGSTLSGQDAQVQAQLTLRVAATRLDRVLNELRALGSVQSENAVGDDVTDQVVDLGARLRNEREVEAEMLKLIKTRNDAPLKEVLELRDKLGSIRQSIEQLEGHAQTVRRQVALASVLVILRPEAKLQQLLPGPGGLGDRFFKEVGGAWTTGVDALTASIAFFIRVFVGGALWWVLLIVAATALNRLVRLNPASCARLTRGA